MRRVYLCTLAGAGTELDPFRPACASVLPNWSADDGRPDPAVQAGWMVVWADVTDAQHATLLGTAGVTYVPIEDAAGNALSLNDPISSIDPAHRAQIRTALEARHIPTDDLTLADPIRHVICHIVRRIRIRRALGANDYTEALDTPVSALSTQRRRTINTALQAHGYDTSGILLTDTIRQALQKLEAQTCPWNRNLWDA